MASVMRFPFIFLMPLFLSAARSTPSQSLLDASDTMANSGYTAMSLTLQLIAPTLPLPPSAALTIFSPPDSSFSDSGQPPLAQLLLHFSPITLSPPSLRSMPFSSSIPTLSPSKHLFMTSSEDSNISINGVKVSHSPVFDDGFVVVYAVDDFFQLNFTLTNLTRIDSKTDFQCLQLERVSRFSDASGALKSRGYSIIASFLDLQIMGFLDRGDFPGNDAVKWTLFAPADQDLVRFSADFLGYSSLFLRHLIPCKLGWSDLDGLVNGTVVSNNVEGFSLEITKDEDDETLMINGVAITSPDLYDSEWLVIHGIETAIEIPENEEEEFESLEEYPDNKAEVSTTSDNGEF